MSLSAEGRKRLNRTGVYVASTAGHVLFFVVLGLSAPEVRQAFVEEPAAPVDLFIPPPPPREPETKRRATQSSPMTPTPVRPRQPVASPLPAPVAPLPLAPVPVPRPAPPSAAPVNGGGSGRGIDPGSIAPGGSLRDALRRSPVGCANDAAVGLNRREKEGCDERLGAGAKDAPFIPAPIAGAKRRDWDAAAARKEIARRRKEGPVPPGTNPSDNAGGTRTDGIGIRGY